MYHCHQHSQTMSIDQFWEQKYSHPSVNGFFDKTEFGYKSVCSQLVSAHYVTTNKIIYVYFSHMTYLMSHVISLNNTCGWSYKLSCSGYSKLATN